MIQYPKQEHVTLPSVEMWGTNMNILKDPPKSVWTRQINKVNETSEITRMIGEDNGDRIAEMIKVYPRGINPMVSVSYSNYGTNGGQNRNVTGAGMFGSNKSCRDGRSAYLGQAKLPYPAVKDGAFRPPVWRQEDLLPLSRLPRTNTSAWTTPGFVNYAKGTSCSKPEKLRQVIEEPVRHSVRPTKIITIQKPLVEPFEVRQVIKNPIFTSVVSVKRGADRAEHVNSDVNGKTKKILEGDIATNKSAQRQVERVVQDVNPERYTAPVRYSEVKSRTTRMVALAMQQSKGKQRAIGEVKNIPVSSRRIKQGAKLLNPGKVGKQRGLQNITYQNVTAVKALPGTLSAPRSEKGHHRQVTEREYIGVEARKSMTEGAVPRRPVKGRPRGINNKDYFNVEAPRTRRTAQTVKPGKLGKTHTVKVVYSNVTANKGTRLSVPFKEAKHSRTAIQEAIHTSASSGINRPNAQPLTDNAKIKLDRSIPRYQASSGKITTRFRQDHEGPAVQDLERKIPLRQATTNSGHAGLGIDSYTNQKRGANIRPTLRTNAGFEGRATVPMQTGDQRGPTLNNRGKSRLLQMAHQEKVSRW